MVVRRIRRKPAKRCATSWVQRRTLVSRRSYMKEWVEEFASLCDANATDKKGCSDQQIKFIEKWSETLWRP
eukprot:Skav202534  [mRNA]  locus=scaffold2011:181221:181550:- [translate_table: standard]